MWADPVFFRCPCTDACSSVFLVFLSTAAAYAANWPEHPVLHAVRATQSPVVDGDLSDPAWQKAPEFTDFTQHDPDDGKPPTMPTSVRIVYDDHAIYFGAKMTDPQKPTRAAGAPRQLRPERLSLDQSRSAARPPLRQRLHACSRPACRCDTILYNDIGEDPSWDGVWDSAMKIVPDGWVAEVRVPFSQLRFPDKPVHVWGINITRRTVRNNEIVRIVNTKKGETGFVSHFADIDGLEGIHRGKPLEIVPYSVARSDRAHARSCRTIRCSQRSDYKADGGLDVKYGADVESHADRHDQSRLRAGRSRSGGRQSQPVRDVLSGEAAVLHRRAEHLQLRRHAAPSHFNFIFPPSLFYSRRIGRAPQGSPNADFADAPVRDHDPRRREGHGQDAAGWTVGVLDALTDAEHARFAIGTDVRHGSRSSR